MELTRVIDIRMTLVHKPDEVVGEFLLNTKEQEQKRIKEFMTSNFHADDASVEIHDFVIEENDSRRD